MVTTTDTSKGVKSFDCTVEIYGDEVTIEEVLAESLPLLAPQYLAVEWVDPAVLCAVLFFRQILPVH